MAGGIKMIDKAKIENEFIGKLKDHLDPAINDRVKTLSTSKRQELIETVKKYYEYLADNGISYGALALEVVNNRGKYGLMANSHLKHQCVFDGIKSEKIAAVREQLIISLAYHDMTMRKNSNHQSNYDYARDIEDYHISVFQSLATVYAWGGLAFRELLGSGSWLRLYERGGSDVDALIALFKNYKQSEKYSSARLLDSLRHTWTHYHEWINGSFVDDVPFKPSADAVSKEYLAKLYDVSESRIVEMTDAPQSETPMVAYKHYEILAASDHPINHENNATTPTPPQLSLEMQELIASYKLKNFTNDYRAEYKGWLYHQVPIDNTYRLSDPSAMNGTIRWLLNIHHSARANKANDTLKYDGLFYISLVSPQKTTFYGNNTEESNSSNATTTKEIHTKSIALSWRQYGVAEEWANNYHSKMNVQKDGSIIKVAAFVDDKANGRNFVQYLWHHLGKPLYFTVVYTTDELTRLGTKCAGDLLNAYGSFDTMKQRGRFVDKDLSRELLADRLNIDVANVVAMNDTVIGTNSLLKSFMVRVDERLIDRERAMVIDGSTTDDCRIVTKHEGIGVIPSQAALEAIDKQRNISVARLVGSLLQQYQWDVEDEIVESILCSDNARELKNEYNQRQPAMFEARREVMDNRFNDPSTGPTNVSFTDYVLNGFGEPFSIHMWYVNRILACRFFGNRELFTSVNNSIRKWNDQLDLLSTKAQLNISLIKNGDYRTYSLICGTIFETVKPVGLSHQKSSIFPDKPSKVYYELECADAKRRRKKESRNNENGTDIEWHRRDRRYVEDTPKINLNREYGRLISRDDTVINAKRAIIERDSNKFVASSDVLPVADSFNHGLAVDWQPNLLLAYLLFSKKCASAKCEGATQKVSADDSVDSRYAHNLAYSAYVP